MNKTSENNNAFLMHLSSFSGYLFPFGSIIVPLIVWEIKKNESEFLNKTGKTVLNFNLSFLLYGFIIVFTAGSIALSMFFNEVHHLNIFFLISLGVLFSALSIIKFVLIIVASIKGNQGELYNYPLTIKFIK